MARKSTKLKEVTEVQQEVDIAKLDMEQQVEIICRTIEALCTELERKGADPYMLSSVLLDAFCSRMADCNDRETFEELMDEALSVEWEDITVH